MADKMRLIDAKDAVKLLRGKCVAKYPSNFLFGLLASATEIEQMSTVDAVPVVHARWEPRADVPGFVRCSHCRDCNIYEDWPDGKKWNHCPNCGAKMDGEGSKENG